MKILRSIVTSIFCSILLVGCGQTKKSTEIDFDTFPDNWTKLTSTESGKVIFNYCGFNVKQIRIFKNPNRGDTLQLNWEYGNDTGVFDIVNSEHGDQEYILTTFDILARKNIIIKVRGLNSKTAFWSSSEDNFVQEDEYVNSNYAAMFKVITEPCD